MKVRDEIEKYSTAYNKPILLWLLTKYHWESQWRFVARCTFEGKYPKTMRIWEPTEEGVIVYNYYLNN